MPTLSPKVISIITKILTGANLNRFSDYKDLKVPTDEQTSFYFVHYSTFEVFLV